MKSVIQKKSNWKDGKSVVHSEEIVCSNTQLSAVAKITAQDSEEFAKTVAGLLKANQIQELLELCEKYLKDNPKDIVALEILAQTQWQLADMIGLLRTTGKLIQLNAAEPGYYYLQGLAYQSLGRLGMASRSFYQSSSRSVKSELRDRSEHALKALDRWQCELVAELIKLDSAFALAFQQSPSKACKEKGFEFSPGFSEDILTNTSILSQSNGMAVKAN